MLIHLILLFYPGKTHRFTDPEVVLYLSFLPKPFTSPKQHWTFNELLCHILEQFWSLNRGLTWREKATSRDPQDLNERYQSWMSVEICRNSNRTLVKSSHETVSAISYRFKISPQSLFHVSNQSPPNTGSKKLKVDPPEYLFIAMT